MGVTPIARRGLRPPRRTILTSLLAGSALTACSLRIGAAVNAVPAKRPNIVVILFDDTGFSDFGCFGSEIATPNIDALAAGGLRYTGFDTKAICSPSRASLLTGRNSHSINMADLAAGEGGGEGLRSSETPGVLRLDAQTIADALRRTGYATFAMGKWHLAPEWEDGSQGNNAHWPLQMGFDRFYGFMKGWADQYRPDLVRQNERIGKPDTPGYHFSEAVIDESIAAINATAAEQPFFLYVALGATHAPMQVWQRYADHYRGRFDAGWDALREERFERMKAMGLFSPDAQMAAGNNGDRRWADLSESERRVFARYMEIYAGFLTHADEQIGRLLDHLDATGRRDDTLILLLSDNGAAPEAGQKGSFGRLYPPQAADADALASDLASLQQKHIEYQRPWAMLGNTPFRRYKGWPYLGGQRTPLIVSWPTGIGQTGGIRAQQVDIVDLAPTIADVAGTEFAAAIDGTQQIPVAGRSIRPTFASPRAPDPRPAQYFELRGNRAIRFGDWRAVAMHRLGTDFAEDRWEVFDIRSDPAEAKDLSATRPDIVALAKAAWQAEARKYGTSSLGEGPEYMRKLDRYRDSFPVDQAPRSSSLQPGIKR